MASAPPVSTMTVFDWQARIIERSAMYLAQALESTASDKQTWNPPCEGDAKARNALEQVGECIGLNQMCAAVLSGKVLPPSDGHQAPPAPPSSAAEAKAALVQSASQVASVIRGLDESALTTNYKLPFAELSGAVILDIIAMNMNYHAGQINYIQLMCGDPEFHISPEMMSF